VRVASRGADEIGRVGRAVDDLVDRFTCWRTNEW
jgi:hypothetical protein